MKKLRDLEKTQGFSKKLKDLAKKTQGFAKNSMLRSQVTQSDSKKSPKKKKPELFTPITSPRAGASLRVVH